MFFKSTIYKVYEIQLKINNNGHTEASKTKTKYKPILSFVSTRDRELKYAYIYIKFILNLMFGKQ